MNEENKSNALALGFQLGLSLACSFCSQNIPQTHYYSTYTQSYPQHTCPAWCNSPEEPPQREYPTRTLAVGTSVVVSTASIYTSTINAGTLIKVL